MAGRSVAWVSQVERGVRRIDRMSVLETLAAALDIPLAELAADAPVVAAVTAGRGDGPEQRAVRAWELTHASRYAELTALLQGPIPDLETAARAVPGADAAAVFTLMASVYQACSAALEKTGEPEAAWIAADRAIAAAERARDPYLMAAGAFRLVHVFLSARHFDQAEEAARTTADALRHLAEDGQPEAMSLWGALMLQRAITAARIGDADAAYGHLERARQMAERVGPGRNDFNTEFGPANTDLHEIAVAVELGDAGRALRACGHRGRQQAVGRTPGPDGDRRCPRARPAAPGQRSCRCADPGGRPRA
jgi:transcriptional regulator with XRE-family HTH domain